MGICKFIGCLFECLRIQKISKIYKNINSLFLVSSYIGNKKTIFSKRNFVKKLKRKREEEIDV